jgi:hypothetical protein
MGLYADGHIIKQGLEFVLLATVNLFLFHTTTTTTIIIIIIIIPFLLLSWVEELIT